jgi:hypothetical protein
MEQKYGHHPANSIPKVNIPFKKTGKTHFQL